MSGGQKRPTGRIAVPSLVAGLFTLSDVDIEFIDEESRDQPGQDVSVRECCRTMLHTYRRRVAETIPP